MKLFVYGAAHDIDMNPILPLGSMFIWDVCCNMTDIRHLLEIVKDYLSCSRGLVAIYENQALMKIAVFLLISIP